MPNKKEKYSTQTTEVFAETDRWLRYAKEDLLTAETLLAQTHIPPRQACWHAQQAAEKALKTTLIFLQIDFPRTHDLNLLRNLVPNSWLFKTTHANLANLTDCVANAHYKLASILGYDAPGLGILCPG